jgi:hypothetical protein
MHRSVLQCTILATWHSFIIRWPVSPRQNTGIRVVGQFQILCNGDKALLQASEATVAAAVVSPGRRWLT